MKNEWSKITEEMVIEDIKNFQKLHGSSDYLRDGYPQM